MDIFKNTKRAIKNFKRANKIIKKMPKHPEKAKNISNVIFKGDGCRDNFCSRLLERVEVILTSHMLGYLMEPIGENENFK